MGKRRDVFQYSAAITAVALAVAIASCGGAGTAMNALPWGSPPPSPSTSPSPTLPPSPSPSPSGLPSAKPLANPVLSDTWNGIGLFQPFDGYISQSEATADAGRYVMTWGPGKPMAWLSGNSQISTGYYLPFDTDADAGDFGSLGHTLAWWQNGNHADWVLYHCDRQTPAWVGGLPKNVPLDISNPAVVAYQMGLVVPYMEANGYRSLAVDVLALNNDPGGCGVWTQNHTVWVPKFSGQVHDQQWANAVMYWMAYTQWYLHERSPQIPVLVNSPGWVNQGDPAEEALIAHLDGFQDEAGFTGWGLHLVTDSSFQNKIWWATYIQGFGKAYLVTDLWQNAEPDPVQRDFAVSTYLMGKAHQSAMVTAQYGNYGVEHYWPEFASPVGSPCGAMVRTQGLYVRKYTGALVVVNPTASTVSYSLPRAVASYADIEGRTVSDPLSVGQDDGWVLLTTNGCT
jgi:hypothetical protein